MYLDDGFYHTEHIRNHFDAEFKKYKLSYQLVVFCDPFAIQDVDEQQEKKPETVLKATN